MCARDGNDDASVSANQYRETAGPTLGSPPGDPANKYFFDNLPTINGIAERSPGFVWRLQEEAGDATSIIAFDDPLIIVNISVWESIEALKAFAFNTAHKKLYERRAAFFAPMLTAHAALWWIKAGRMPTIDDGKAALASLDAHGPTEAAFTFATPFPAVSSY